MQICMQYKLHNMHWKEKETKSQTGMYMYSEEKSKVLKIFGQILPSIYVAFIGANTVGKVTD